MILCPSLRKEKKTALCDFICKWSVETFRLDEQNLSSLKLAPYIKIVRALWLAERSFCMRMKHCCDVKVFCFSLVNHASTNLNKFLSWKLDKFTYPLLMKLGKSLQTCYVNFFRLSWYFKREKSIFWKAFFCTTRTDPENLNQ